MGYKFNDFGQAVKPTPLSIRPIIDGAEADLYFAQEGFTFTTISVSGRGNTSYRTEITETNGNDGGLLRSKDLASRTIVIRALVTAKSNEAYRKGLEWINKTMYHVNIHKLKFTDDMKHTFYGVCQRVEDEGEKFNKQIIEIEFLCNDPFKYTDEALVQISSGLSITLDTDFAIIPEQILLMFPTTAGATSFTLTNATTGKKIVFSQSTTATTSTVYIRQLDDFIGNYSGVNKLDGLNVFYSDFDDFKVNNGDILTVSPSGTIQIKYKGARL